MNQPPATALSEYTRMNSPIIHNGSLDFCNSFWDFVDAGVEPATDLDVLFARMRGAAQTIEDLNAFWKERASIEEDYAKRLANLAEMALGRDEIGDLRKSLDAIRADTELQAVSHWNLAQQFRSEFEVPTTAFHARQLYHKRTCQDGVEKLFKTRQNGESYVSKTRELNHQEHCFRINVMIAQASQAQGKELKRIIIKIKLERAQLKVERDRMNFLKDILLNYANAVSTVCAAADVSCQAMKVAFERTEPEKDVEIFIREYGIGKIPDTSDFVTGSAPDSTPSALAQPTSRIAGVIRSRSREIPLLQNSMPLEEGPAADTTGVNEGGTAFKKNEPYTSESVVDPSCQPTAMSSKAQPVPDTNGIQLTASMAKNQNDNVDALTKQLEELQVSTSQNTRRPLTNPPTVDSMVPKFTQPAGAEIAQALTDHEPALPGEHTSPRLRSSSTGRHALSLRQAFISGGGDDDGAPLPTTAPHQDQPILTPQQQQMLMGQHHQMLAAQPQQQEQMFQLLQQQPRMVHVLYHDSIPVWRSPSRLLSQAMDDSDVQVEESGGYCHSSVDEPEVHTPVMLPQLTSDRLNLFLRQQHQHSLNSNVNPINFVIQKRMKLRRIATRVHSLSTSGSSIKLGTDSFISCSS